MKGAPLIAHALRVILDCDWKKSKQGLFFRLPCTNFVKKQ